jgi:hypothetical protein
MTTISATATVVFLTILSARIAQQMAAYQNRPVRYWLWLAALTGPLAPMALAVLPRRARR